MAKIKTFTANLVTKYRAHCKYHGWLGDKWKYSEADAERDEYDHRTSMQDEKHRIKIVLRQHEEKEVFRNDN